MSKRLHRANSRMDTLHVVGYVNASTGQVLASNSADHSREQPLQDVGRQRVRVHIKCKMWCERNAYVALEMERLAKERAKPTMS